MTTGQTRVAVLVAVLLVLELLVHQGVKTWLQTAWANINNALSHTTGTNGGDGILGPPAPPDAPIGSGSKLINTDPSGNCRAGYHLVQVSGGKRMCLPDK